MIVVGGMGSVAGSVLGAGIIILLLEALRAVKGAQEVVFGAVLLFFVLFLRGGLISVVQRYVKGWQEPLHGAGAKPAPPAAQPAPDAAVAGERSAT